MTYTRRYFEKNAQTLRMIMFRYDEHSVALPIRLIRNYYCLSKRSMTDKIGNM